MKNKPLASKVFVSTLLLPIATDYSYRTLEMYLEKKILCGTLLNQARVSRRMLFGSLQQCLWMVKLIKQIFPTPISQ